MIFALVYCTVEISGVIRGFEGASTYKRLGGGANVVSHGYTKGSGLGAEIIGTFVLLYTVFSATDAKRSARDSYVPIDNNVAREIINHRSLWHPNKIRFKEVVLTPTHLAIVMEYAAGGELFERICNAGRFREDEMADVWSCGVTLYEMLVGAYPFEDQEDPKKFRKTIQWHGS